MKFILDSFRTQTIIHALSMGFSSLVEENNIYNLYINKGNWKVTGEWNAFQIVSSHDSKNVCKRSLGIDIYEC